MAKYLGEILTHKKDEGKHGHTSKNDQTKTQFTRVSQLSGDVSQSGRMRYRGNVFMISRKPKKKKRGFWFLADEFEAFGKGTI